MATPKFNKVIDLPKSIEVDVSKAIVAIAEVAIMMSEVISLGDIQSNLDKEVGENSDGDNQKALDVLADEAFMKKLSSSSVSWYASEEQEEVVELNKTGSILLAIDPLDGSSNISNNVSIGTIFSLRSARGVHSKKHAREALLSPGENQLAAGYVIYGPQTTIILTAGSGVSEYILDKKAKAFTLCRSNINIPKDSAEYSINSSNYRHWSKPMKAYFDDLNLGIEGPAGKNFNMRWVASLVADTHRILSRGGIFIYPSDNRKGYEKGRLRMVYECAPIAFIIAQAGGGATDIYKNILSVAVEDLHERTPFVFGSINEVNRVQVYHDLPGSEVSPLFGKRGLFSGQAGV